MKVKFESDYSRIILKRGLEYYQTGNVKRVVIKDGIVCAIVNGTNTYHVSLEIKGDEILNTECDCPYFYEHDECKHITAVLYYLKKENAKNTDNDSSVKDILDKIDVKELKKFLKDLIENDEDIYDVFRRNFLDYFPKVSPSAYKRKIEQAIYESGGRDGFIGYSEGREYVRRMEEFTKEGLSLVSKKDYETAFTIAKIILDSIPNTAIDGSNGETSIVANSCIEVIIAILYEAPKNHKTIRDIFDYTLHEIKTNTLYNYGIELHDLIINFIRNDLFIKDCEKALIAAIDDCDESKWYSYTKNFYLECLEELYAKDENIFKQRKLIESNLDNLEMFKKYVDILIKEKNINEVVKTLIEFRKKYQKNEEYITDKLLEIYQKNKMNLEYKEELYQAFFQFDKFNFEKYIMIKKLYSKKEWVKEVENIISKLEKFSDSFRILTEIFIAEKMIDRLYNLVKDDSNINYYEKYLLSKYRDEIIEKNIEKCQKSLRVAYNRSDYRRIADELKHIKKIDVKRKYITSFLTWIRKEYANKPALMDEISKV